MYSAKAELPEPLCVATRRFSAAGVNATRSFADFSAKLGLENSTAIRSIRKLRNCGGTKIPGMPRESPSLALSLALDLTLRFGAEKLRMASRFKYTSGCVLLGTHVLSDDSEVSPTLQRNAARPRLPDGVGVSCVPF
jgi:hypothetical protein